VDKNTEQKILQAANLAPSEAMLEKIVEVHPMKQVAIMSVVQVVVLASMLLGFWIIQAFIDSGIKL
jgi:hypothetical protein